MEETGRTLVHPFDDAYVIAGQGTVGLEILDDAPGVEVVVVPVGGGGLMAGVATAAKGRREPVRVVAVEPEGSAVLNRSLAAGKPVRLEGSSSIADGLVCPIVGERCFRAATAGVDESVTVSDDEIRAGMRFLYARAKLAAEPAGAAGVAALLAGKVQTSAGRPASPSLSRAETWLPKSSLVSWPSHEDGHPSRVRARHRALLGAGTPSPRDRRRRSCTSRSAPSVTRSTPASRSSLTRAAASSASSAASRRPRRRAPDREPFRPMNAPIGGQAVLEGVMMRGPTAWALAVRKPDGEIAEVNRPISSALARHRWLRAPVIRGIVALGESLGIGFRALAISAQYAAPEGEEVGEDGKPVQTELTRTQLIFAFAIAIGFAVMLFKVSPALITNWLPIEGTSWFVIVEGLIRVGMFIAYLALISLWPDLRRVFQYHAAEHKAINAYEAGDPLEPEVVQRHSLLHVRCGTAFLLYVMVVAIFVFAFFGRPEWYWLVLSRIAALPLIAGIAYEIIRFAGRHPHNPFLRIVLAPGLWLQRLTTRQPTLDQVEVSIQALREVLRLEGRITPEQRKVEVMA